MNTPPALLRIFNAHIPQKSITYCVNLWHETPFSFHIKSPRVTKLGDFRYRANQKIQTITLNSDLNPYQFLLTLIHEIAHLRAFEKYGTNHAPHGIEWKNLFQELMTPLLSDSIFPKDLLIPLKIHMKNPAASSTKDQFLMKEMSKYDPEKSNDGKKFLSDLTPGTSFSFLGKTFKKGDTRRTRILCEEIGSGKKFLVSSLARVEPLD
jgi:hypothetical protein